MSPVSVSDSFATAPISPALSSPIGLLLLAVEQQQLADPLVGVARRVPDVRLRMERAGQHAQVRQSPDERVRGRLEHADQERAALVGGDAHRLTALVAHLDRRLVGRGGEVADDRVEQRLQADALGRGSDEDRREDRFLDALAQARLELGVRDLLALEVLGQDVVVRLGRGFEQLIAARGDLSGKLVGDRDLDLLRTVEAERLAVDEVDVSLERLRRADRQVERRDLGPERRPQRVQRLRRVGVLAVGLVDEEAGRGVRGTRLRNGLLEPGLHAARGVHDEDRAVGRGEAFDDLRDEVRVARRVDERDAGPVGFEGADREAQRRPPLLLLGLEVEVGRPVVDATEPGDRPGPEEQLLGQRRLAGPGVAGQDDASEVGEVDTLHRHGFVGP